MERQAFPAPAPVPSWARPSGRAGEGEPLFAAGAGLALLDAYLRRDPPSAGALRCRLALRAPRPQPRSCASTPTRPRCATCASPSATTLGPAAKLLWLWRDLVGRPPSLDPGRILDATARLDLALPDPNGLASSLKDCAGEGDPVSAAAKAAASAFSIFPDAPAAEAEILALWLFDLILAIRLRWPRPLPLIATKILDPALRSDGGGRREAGRARLAENRRRRDRARRRLGPRSRR